jgi:Pin2-interacting protein X1
VAEVVESTVRGTDNVASKRKLGADPNNTKWLRNTGSFGQKILRSQGWQPGENLGAKDAPHAEFHTDASASHIRVVMKDDNLGLGAKRNNGDECTGLDAFQDLLGRLNGKSDEAIEGERKARNDLKLSLYVERKIGTIRFVRGGWLVGDEMAKGEDGDAAKENNRDGTISSSENPESTGEEKVEKKKSKKRKARDEEVTEDANEDRESNKSKKRRKEKDSQTESDEKSSRKSKKDKKRRKEEKERRREEGSSVSDDGNGERSESDPVPAGSAAEDTDSSKSKKSKDKSRRKERPSEGGETEGDDERSSKKKKKRRKEDEGSTSSALAAKAIVPTAMATAVSTPTVSGYSTPTEGASMRHYSRKKMIAHKQMAFADPKALAQVSNNKACSKGFRDSPT